MSLVYHLTRDVGEGAQCRNYTTATICPGNDDGSSPDVICVVKINGVEIPTLIIELKSLLGDSGLDTSIQVEA